MRTSLFPLGESERMQDHLREAEALATALGDQRRLGRVSNYMVIQSLFDSDYEAALRFGRRALDLAVTLGDVSIAAPANAYLATGHVNRGELFQAVGHLQRNIDLAQHLGCTYAGDPAWVMLTCVSDVAFAAQTAVIAAHSLGINTLLTNGTQRGDPRRIWKLLDLPPRNCFPTVALSLGYATSQPATYTRT